MRIGAIEAGGTKMVLAVGDENGNILERMSIPTEAPEVTMPKMIAYFKERNVERLGIGCFGPVCLDKNSPKYGHILATPKVLWKDCDFLGIMQRALNIPMGIDTDVNASAIGEATWGVSKDVDSSIYITIGTGVGVGVIVDGKPVHGMLHPEGGHILLQRYPGDDFKCNCLFHECCMEGMAAGPAIQKRWGKPAVELADCKEVWELEAFYIAQALMNYILILSPKRIILGGGVMHQEHLMPLVRAKVKELMNGYIVTDEMDDLEHYIVLPGLNDNQGIMGCIKIALDADN